MTAPETAGGVPDSLPGVTRFEGELAYSDFEVTDVLGRGGNATVSAAAVRGDPDRVVALKEPHAPADLPERFRAEAETWAGLDDHDHVVGVHAWGAEPHPWIVLEYMDGGSLLRRTGDCGLDEGLWIGATVATAVDHAHRRGVAHLDLKPENVLFREASGDAWAVPKVADWGLARALRSRSVNLEGLSPLYAAPEQFDPDRWGPPGPATDVYGLGVVLYELLVGSPPFAGPPGPLREAVLAETPPPPSGRNPALSPAIDDLLDRALAKAPADRYASMFAFRRAIEETLAERVGADPGEPLAGTAGGALAERPPDDRPGPARAAGTRGEDGPAPYDRALALADEGFVQLSEGYFARREPAPPLEAWRRGVTLADARAGRAVERTVPDDAGERVSLAGRLLDGLAACTDHVVLGPPGSGKSTVCKQVACEWFDRGRGAVFYRESGRGERFDRPDALARRVTEADGHALVVVEDAIRPEANGVFEFLDRVRDVEGVTVLLDAREAEWRGAGRGGELFSADPVADLEPTYVPRPDAREHGRFVEAVQAACDRPIEIDVEQLQADVELATAGDADAEGTRPGELFYLLHRLTALARDPLAGDDAPTTLTDVVAEAYERVAALGDGALDVGVCVNALNAAGIGTHPELLYAVVPAEPLAVDEAVDALEGRVVFPREADWGGGVTAYPTGHEAWSTAFLDHWLDVAGETAARERFGRVLGRVLSLADDAAARERVSGALAGDAPYLARIERDPEGWADETVEAVYALGRERPKLAPLFGDDGVELPRACSDRVRAQRPVWLGRLLLGGGYLDRAERVFERMSRGDPDRAVERLLGLADVANARGDFDDAVDAAGECLATVAGDDRPIARARAQLTLGRALTNRGDFDAARSYYRAALEEFEAVGDRRRMAAALNRLGANANERGAYDRGREYLERGLRIARELGDRRRQVDLLEIRGQVARRQGDPEAARDSFERSLAMKRELGDRAGVADTLNSMGVLVQMQAENDRARRYFERSLEIRRELGDRSGEADVLGNLGINAAQSGEYDRAREHFERSLAAKRDIGDRSGEASLLDNLAIVARHRAEYDRAREALERSLELKQDLGDEPGEAMALANLGEVDRVQGEYERARERYERALDIHRRLGERGGEARSLVDLGVVALRRGDLERAGEHLERGLDLARDVDSRVDVAKARSRLGEVARRRNQHDKARDHTERALETAEAGDNRFETNKIRLARARVALSRGNRDTARELASTARERFESIGAVHWVGRSRLLLGRVAAESGETASAREHWTAALETFEAVGAPQDALSTLERLVESPTTDDRRADQWCRRAENLLGDAPDAVADQHRAWIRRACSGADGGK